MRFLFMVGITVWLLSCNGKDLQNIDLNSGDLAELNSVTVVSDSNRFVFETLAENKSLDESYTLNFDATRLLFVVTVTNYNGGSALLTLRDKNNGILREEALNANRIQTSPFTVNTPPARIDVKLDNYSGNISVVFKNR